MDIYIVNLRKKLNSAVLRAAITNNPNKIFIGLRS